MKKVLIFLLIGIFLISFISLISINLNGEDIKVVDDENVEDRLFQGPMPEGYNEEYFRQTGITRTKEIE